MEICPLTNQRINIEMPNPGTMEFYYETPKTGRVRITDVALRSAQSLSPEEKYILTGICRNKTIKNEPPIQISSAFLKQLNDQNIPYGFEEKARHFLQFLYDNGGKEYKGHTIDTDKDSPITYSSRDEFERIIKFLDSEGWIIYESYTGSKQSGFYLGLRISKDGIREIEKGLPKMPMFNLVNQKISSGDAKIDSQIEHARALFFDDNSSLERKRSACETLSFVLEPLRDELKIYFGGDVEVFFRIVN